METKKNFKYSPELYDMQVNWAERFSKEKTFFEKIITERNIKKILDVGCGTAHHVQMFSEILEKLGFKEIIIAVDPSEEMIEYAAKNVVKAKNIKLIKSGFAEIETLTQGSFDMITCLGNTLALLGTRKNVKAALKSTRKKLVKGGIAVFQFLNFEPRIIEENRFYKPKISTTADSKYIFLKHFEFGKVNTRADFIIIQIDDSGSIVNYYNNSSLMCTLRKNIFLKMAYNAGFKKAELLATGGQEQFDKNKHISLYALLYK